MEGGQQGRLTKHWVVLLEPTNNMLVEGVQRLALLHLEPALLLLGEEQGQA